MGCDGGGVAHGSDMGAVTLGIGCGVATMIEDWERNYLQAINRERFRPPAYRRKTYDDLVLRGYLEKYTFRYKHIFYYRLTDKGYRAIEGNSDDGNLAE